MSNKFLSYLFKNRKVAIVFFLLIYLGLSFTPYINSMMGDAGEIRSNYGSLMSIAIFMSVMLSYALPVILFSYVHSKKSVDLYFSLPVKRSQQLITNIFFATVISFGYFFITTLLGYVIFASKVIDLGSYLIVLGYTLLFLLVMICINTLLFIVANNLFDGIVMIASYSGLALLIFLVADSFMSNIVVGSQGVDFAKSAAYFSPLMMGADTFGKLTDIFIVKHLEHPEGINGIYLVIMVILGLIACYGMYRHFVLRKTERAEQVSDEFFAYPLIIHFYAIGCLAILAFNSIRMNIMDFLPYYFVLLFIYIVATFVYKRKISVKPRYLAFFIISAIVTLLFGQVAWNTRGFKLAENYSLTKGDVLDYYAYCSMIDDDESQVYIYLSIPTKEIDKYKEAIDIMEKKRRNNIDIEYARKNSESFGIMTINSNYYINNRRDEVPVDRGYRYVLNDLFTTDELKVLDKYGNIEIFDYESGENISFDEYLKKKEGK